MIFYEAVFPTSDKSCSYSLTVHRILSCFLEVFRASLKAGDGSLIRLRSPVICLVALYLLVCVIGREGNVRHEMCGHHFVGLWC
mmetsp:Transcript_28747/g.65261  ORF Transcript_28747/g.65261 Transcript_28747/m.65261 type:complete len:84 (-) Transcript_28747:476-727(-)